MIKIIKKTSEGYKIEAKNRFFWLKKYEDGIEISVLAYETKYKRVFQALGVFKTHLECANYLRGL